MASFLLVSPDLASFYAYVGVMIIRFQACTLTSYLDDDANHGLLIFLLALCHIINRGAVPW